MPALDASAIDEFLRQAFPGTELPYRTTAADDTGVEMVMGYDPRTLRPGGTISGPTLMAFADCISYAAVVSRIGPEFLTVTSHLAIDFLRKAPPGDLRGRAELLKVGRRQALVAVHLHSEVSGELVAYCTCTYALPSAPTVPRADLA